MRRGVGRSRARNRVRNEAALKQTGAAVRAEEVKHIQKQWQFIETKLREFAQQHRSEINTSPEFRREFMKMCVEVGIDPLMSTKSFWGNIMGNLSQFYHELGVQVLDVCYGTRSQNGGLIAMDDLVEQIRRLRGTQADQVISADDVATSLKHLKLLGNGLRLLNVADNAGQFVVSVPQEFDMDHQLALTVARESGGFLTKRQLRESHGWEEQRIDRAIKKLIQSGMVWIDAPGPEDADMQYWFPTLFVDDNQRVDIS